MTIHAWYLPPSFSVRETEMASLSPGIRYGTLSEARLVELMGHLREERARTLAEVPVERVVTSVDRVATRLSVGGDPLRAWTMDRLAGVSGLSEEMAEEVVRGMARGWAAEPLWILLRSEFGDPRVLDGFVPTESGGRTRALGPALAFHLGAGTVPGVATTSLIRSLLVKTAVLLRPGRGDLTLTLAFCRGLAEEDPELAGNLAVLYWPSSEDERTSVVLRQTDLVVAYGGDDTIEWIRRHLPPSTPLRAYRHRMGFGLVGRKALGGEASARDVARDAAQAVALFDQRGCVSPHVLFVEKGGEVAPIDWARLLADAFDRLEEVLPSGPVPPETGVAIQQLRGASELAESLGEGMVLHGGNRAPWTVVFDPGGSPEPSCLSRVVRVLPVAEVGEALAGLRDWTPFLQTVGLEGFGERTPDLEERLARLGVSRIVPFSSVPWPETWWHHDGSGPLLDLVRWTDVEGMP
jgi:hypothetical protein